MVTLNLPRMTLSVDFPAGRITSLLLGGREHLFAPSPLFRLRLRNKAGEATLLDAYGAHTCRVLSDGASYTDFALHPHLSVRVYLTEEKGEAAWRVAVEPGDDEHLVEWIDFPLAILPPLKENGGEGEILFPYNEGAMISDAYCREEIALRYTEPEYPSRGAGAVFPNMVCTQMLAYVKDDLCLYTAAHDAARGVKGIDFHSEEGGVSLRMRLFCGVDAGETFRTDYPIVWAAVRGGWESAAERYRAWFASALPKGVKKIKDNPSLPAWYADSPLVVGYPVRGVHDTDEMKSNALYPYTAALPLLREIKEATGSRIMALLMHWEGTAPWAPPYVWPPYGGEENFLAFRDALHKEGDLVGVYCSGFGYTIQSRLVENYNQEKDFEERGLASAMCAAPDGKVCLSGICIAQRSGYDICVASPLGKKLLTEAYYPLLDSGVDYAQILDQNHGGGQYFCYSRDHGHPAAPGPWMTATMGELLSDWNRRAPHMLLGCESAAAEPFIGNLCFSDNRFELNYRIGRPVPLYAYLYHEYVRNFMGNQVGCPFPWDVDTLRYRLGYAFSIGDAMTVVMSPDGKLLSEWGTREFENTPNKEKALAFIAKLTKLYRERAKPYLFAGRMIPCPAVTCETVTYGRRDVPARSVTLPAVLASAWETENGARALLLVNPTEKDVTCTVNGIPHTVPAMDAVLMEE